MQLDWWRRELEGAPALLLPTDAPRPAAPAVARCGWLDVTMDAGVVARLEALAVQCDATMFMLLLGALQLLLCAHGRTDDVTVCHLSSLHMQFFTGCCRSCCACIGGMGRVACACVKP